MPAVLTLISFMALFAGPVAAQSDVYHITEAEKSACSADAVRFCASSYPDEGKLLACMTANRKSLGSNCAAVFKSGKQARGLN